VVLLLLGVIILRDAESEWRVVAEKSGPFISGLIPIFDLEQLGWKIEATGNPLGLTAESFIGAKCIMSAVGIFIGSGVSFLGIPPILVVLLGALFYALPDVYLKKAFEKRQRKIYRDFPGLLSLIATAVGAGIDFDPALNAISRRFPGPLGDELRAAWKEIAIGKSRASVLRQMARRTGVLPVERFFETIITARERGGVELSSMIDMFNKELVESQRRKIHEESQKIPTKMLVPIFSCIFVPTIIMIMTPVGLSMMEIF